jgi:hypothetical protein
MIIFVYAVLVFLVLRFSVTLFNFLSNPKLGYYGKHFTDKVSIIVLSSSSGADVKNLLGSIEQQDYEYTELIVQEGESEEELVNRATGRYLLFLDAGTTVQYGLINNLIYRVKVFDLAVLSLIPTYKVSGFKERFLLLNLLPLRLIRLSSLPAFATGSNGCLFFDALIYKRYRWHNKLNHKLLASAEIIKLVKQQQLKAEVLLANKFVYNCADLEDTSGFAKRLLMNFGNNALIALLYLLLVIAGPVVVLVNFNPALAVLPFGLIFLSRVMIAFLTAQNPFVNVLLHPLQMILLFLLLLKGVGDRILMSIKPN